MPPPNLSPREQFLATGVEPETCNICLEPFIWGHDPVRFTGTDSCDHVFGATCIQEWVESSNENANRCPTCRHELFRSDTPRADEVEWTLHVDADMALDDDLLHSDSNNDSEFDSLSVAYAEQWNLSSPQLHGLMREAEQSLHDAVNSRQEQETLPVESEDKSDSLRLPLNLKDITLREHATDFATDLLSRLRLYTATYTPSNGELHRHFERTCEAYGIDGYPTLWCNEWPQICSVLG